MKSSSDWALGDKKWVAAAGVILIVTAGLMFQFTSPRSRLNVMQGSAVIFFGILLLRLRSRARSTNIPDQSPGEAGLLPLAGVMLAASVWASMLSLYFINDDFGLLLQTDRLTVSHIWSFFRHGDGGVFYRPLTYATYILDQAMWGRRPFGFHLTNLLLHAVSAVTIFMLVRLLGGRSRAAWMTAGIFAAMPIQVESVSWMAGRFDVLSTTLGLLTVASYLRARAHGGGWRYALPLGLYVLAGCSKETGFVIPLLLLAVELVIFRSFPFRRIALFLTTGAVLFLWRWFALGGFGGYRDGGASTMTGFTAHTFEALLLRGPSQLLLGFNWTEPSAWMPVAAALTAALLIFIVVRAEISSRGRRVIMLSLTWMLVAMIPGHFLLMIGPGLSNSRTLCLASAGMAILLGELVSGLNARTTRNTAYAALVALFSLGVWHNIGAWRWTASLGKEALRQVVQLEPAPVPGTQFVFSQMPPDIRGVFFFAACLPEALKIEYGRDDVAAFRDSEVPEADDERKPRIHLIWTGDPSGLFRRER